MQSWKTVHDIEDEPILGGSWLISGALIITMVHDRNADCDADGNRGRDVTYEDERRWTLLSATPAVGDDWGEALTGADIPPEVVAAAETWAETHQPNDDGPQDDEEPPDMDGR
jgi:hypothetical protein